MVLHVTARVTWATFYHLKFSLYGCGYMLKEVKLKKKKSNLWWLVFMKVYSGNSQQKFSLFSSISPAERNYQPPLRLPLWCHQSQPELFDVTSFLMILFLLQFLEKRAEEFNEELTLLICFRFLKWAESKIFIMPNWLVYFLEDQHESADDVISSTCDCKTSLRQSHLGKLNS